MDKNYIMSTVRDFAAKKLEAPLYPGATRILSSTKDMEGLNNWRERIGEEEADRILLESQTIGTSLDGLVESYFSNPDFDINNHKSELGYGLFKQLHPKFKDIECGATQLTVWSDHAKIKGIIDLFGLYKGVPTVMDIKNSLRPKKPEFIEDYFLQCTMYALSMHDLLGLDIKQIALLIAVRPGKGHLPIPQVFVRDTKDYIRPALKRIKEYHQKFDYIQQKSAEIVK